MVPQSQSLQVLSHSWGWPVRFPGPPLPLLLLLNPFWPARAITIDSVCATDGSESTAYRILCISQFGVPVLLNCGIVSDQHSQAEPKGHSIFCEADGHVAVAHEPA